MGSLLILKELYLKEAKMKIIIDGYAGKCIF